MNASVALSRPSFRKFPKGGTASKYDIKGGKAISHVRKHMISRGSGSMLPQEIFVFWTP